MLSNEADIIIHTQIKICIVMTYPSVSPQLEIWGGVTGFEEHSGLGMCQGSEPDTGEFLFSFICMKVHVACDNGCMVNGMCAMMAN